MTSGAIGDGQAPVTKTITTRSPNRTRTSKKIRTKLEAIETDNGNAVFFSSHILEIVQNMCDRVIIIDRGRILADAPVTELREMQGDRSLEDIFLELTGGKDVDDMVKELGNVG